MVVVTSRAACGAEACHKGLDPLAKVPQLREHMSTLEPALCMVSTRPTAAPA